MRLILASQSPRRKELLATLNIPFEVISVSIDEQLDDDLPLPFALEKLALRKASALDINDALILAADTVVVLDQEVLNKPKDLMDAKKMLKKMSNKTHEVISAVCLLYGHEHMSFHDITKVTFDKLTDAWIENYVTNYPILDKSGSYGIQDHLDGHHFITNIEGDVFNVMGLPVDKLKEVFDEMKVGDEND